MMTRNKQIIDHNHPSYRKRRGISGSNKWNGAFYYSEEIVKNIIPFVDTDRNWMTINTPSFGMDHSIVFIHNNLHPELYDWLSRYKDLILVCGIPETCVKMTHLGIPVYLPLSVDVEQVRSYTVNEKTKDMAFFGRKSKRKGIEFPEGTDIIEGIPRTKMLSVMAEYRKVFAVGRTAIEAKILGCEILPYDPRFPNPDRWKIVDNREAAALLNQILKDVDRKGVMI